MNEQMGACVRYRLQIILSLIFLVVMACVMRVSVYAVENCSDGDVQCFDKRIEEYKQKITDLQGQQKTLSSTIKYLEAKSYLTEGEIRRTQLDIASLEKEIEVLSNRIGGLEISLKRLSEILITRIQEGYKRRAHEPVLLFFSSQGFGDFITKLKYMELAQQYTQSMIHDSEEQKVSYDNEKTLKQKKQEEVETLRRKLEAQRKTLQQQKEQKQSILTATKNDESKFQSLLAQALSEKNALEAALVSGKKVGPVKRGESIALVGNSGYPGCSTGEHLHFEIRKNNTWVDPENYLSSRTVKDNERGGNSTLGHGSWDWPLQDPIALNQHFGHTPYSWRYKYSGGIHTGLDLNSGSSKVIRAPADGTLFSASQSCGSSTINIKYIDHGDNVISFYLHVQ